MNQAISGAQDYVQSPWFSNTCEPGDIESRGMPRASGTGSVRTVSAAASTRNEADACTGPLYTPSCTAASEALNAEPLLDGSLEAKSKQACRIFACD